MFLEVAIIFCGTFSVFETKQEFFPVLVRSIISHLKKRVYLRKKLPCVNVKVEPRSNLTFTRSFSYIVSILFTHVKPVKVYVRTHVKITRQWKSTFTNIFDSKKLKITSISNEPKSWNYLSWSLYITQKTNLTQKYFVFAPKCWILFIGVRRTRKTKLVFCVT